MQERHVKSESGSVSVSHGNSMHYNGVREKGDFLYAES